MAKGKKKDSDFQKVKLKVGRKLKRDCNETKAEFKSRKIILKEVKSYSDDPITALARHSDHISQHGKLSLLNHFNTALTQTIVKALTKPMIDCLAKFIIDHSDQVRAATYRCLKTCINHMKQGGMPLKDFTYLLKPYLDCAFTHIDRGINGDCLRFIDYLVNINEPQMFEPVMNIVLRRLTAGDVTSKEFSIAQKLKHLYLKHQSRTNLESERRNEQIKPLIWTPNNYLMHLDLKVHDLDCENYRISNQNDDREVFLIPKPRIANVAEEFLNKVTDDGGFKLESDDQLVQPKPKRFRSQLSV